MPKRELENLVPGGTLKVEPPAAAEIEGLIRSGETRLHDAENGSLSIESRSISRTTPRMRCPSQRFDGTGTDRTSGTSCSRRWRTR